MAKLDLFLKKKNFFEQHKNINSQHSSSMFLVLISIVFVLFCCVPSQASLFSQQWLEDILLSSEGGGIECAGCTILSSLLEQLSVLHNKPVEHVMDEICSFLPTGAKQTCEHFVAQYGKEIIRLFEMGLNPGNFKSIRNVLFI